MKDISELSDREIVDALLARDPSVTRRYLYRQCYPLFSSIFRRYHTDCQDPMEFINEIYVYILSPRPDGQPCRLASFGFKCTLTMWLKVVAQHFCHHAFAKKGDFAEEISPDSDRFTTGDESLELNTGNLNMNDLNAILNSMPNERYRRIIRLRYLEELSNEETAQALQMSMDNFYNKHRLAKAQFCQALRKEGLL